jgi:hypothetical protein
MRASARRVSRAAKTLLRLGLCVLLGGLLATCSVGHGTGSITGTVNIDGCKEEGPYSLAPDAFYADTAEQLLSIRVQRGGDIEGYSDGIAVLVKDAALIKKQLLGTTIELSARIEPLVGVTAYFNETCFSDRDKVPVLLEAVSGSIRFDAIYAPLVDKSEVRISATLDSVMFRDVERPNQRWAQLGGSFDFLYVRGAPAQHFP